MEEYPDPYPCPESDSGLHSWMPVDEKAERWWLESCEHCGEEGSAF